MGDQALDILLDIQARLMRLEKHLPVVELLAEDEQFRQQVEERVSERNRGIEQAAGMKPKR